jgi:RNA polymerase sigma-B factor
MSKPKGQNTGKPENDYRKKLIFDNLDLVIPVVKKALKNNEIFEDLMQVGYIGLIKAAENFEPDKGVQFSTYATYCIDGEIKHYLRDKSHTVRLPRWLKQIETEMASFIDTFLQKESRLPTIPEISRHLNISEDGIIEILKSKNIVSLSLLSDKMQEKINLDLIRSVQYSSFKLPLEDVIILEQALERLKDFERKIIYLFFYKDLTQTQIAQKLGLSQKKVSRQISASLKKLRKFIFPAPTDETETQ